MLMRLLLPAQKLVVRYTYNLEVYQLLVAKFLALSFKQDDIKMHKCQTKQ